MTDFDTLLALLPSLIYPALTLAQLLISRRATHRPGGREMVYGSAASLLVGLVQFAFQYSLLTETADYEVLGTYWGVLGFIGMAGTMVFLIGLGRLVGSLASSGREGRLLDRY